MAHPYDKAANCQCPRCIRERARRAAQAAATPEAKTRPAYPLRKVRERRASRAEQYGRYLDAGPGAWDDNTNPDY